MFSACVFKSGLCLSIGCLCHRHLRTDDGGDDDAIVLVMTTTTTTPTLMMMMMMMISMVLVMVALVAMMGTTVTSVRPSTHNRIFFIPPSIFKKKFMKWEDLKELIGKVRDFHLR